MKGIYIKEITHLALRGVGWVGKAVMLTSTALPATAVRHKLGLMGRRDTANIPEISAPRKKTVAS
jgi:hypothetical protein